MRFGEKTVSKFLRKESRSYLIAFATITLLLIPEYYGWFSSLESLAFDLSIKPERVYDRPAPPVIVVDVDDVSYRDCFEATSPLRPSKVQTLVRELARRADKGVLAVDLITDSKEYRNIEDWPEKTVWAVSAAIESEEDSFWDWLSGRHVRTVRLLSPVLGDSPRPGPRKWAVPAFPFDQDSTVRRLPRYFTQFDPAHPLAEIPVSSLATSVANAYRSAAAAPLGHEIEEDVHLDFDSHQPKRISVATLSKTAPDDSDLRGLCNHSSGTEFGAGSTKLLGFDVAEPSAADWSNSITVLGGTFGEAKDFVRTPIGRLSGVAVNAIAIQGELEGHHLAEWPRGLFLIVDYALGFGLCYLLWKQYFSARELFLVVMLYLGLCWGLTNLVLYWLSAVWINWTYPFIGAIVAYVVEILLRNPTTEG